MARTLKGLAFVRKVDLGTPDAEAYLFAEKNGPRRALVAWADAHGGGTATVRVAANAPKNVRRVDLFGNVSPQEAAPILTLPIDLDPVYVSWEDGGATGIVQALPNPLLVPPTVTVSGGGPDTIAVRVRNALDTPLEATLTVHAGAASGVTPTQATLPVHVPAGQTQTIAVPVRVSADARSVIWPRRWTVFAPVPAGSGSAAVGLPHGHPGPRHRRRQSRPAAVGAARGRPPGPVPAGRRLRREKRGRSVRNAGQPGRPDHHHRFQCGLVGAVVCQRRSGL